MVHLCAESFSHTNLVWFHFLRAKKYSQSCQGSQIDMIYRPDTNVVERIPMRIWHTLTSPFGTPVTLKEQYLDFFFDWTQWATHKWVSRSNILLATSSILNNPPMLCRWFGASMWKRRSFGGNSYAKFGNNSWRSVFEVGVKSPPIRSVLGIKLLKLENLMTGLNDWFPCSTKLVVRQKTTTKSQEVISLEGGDNLEHFLHKRLH